MRISEMLNAIASWLESPDNEAILLAEYDDDCLKIVAQSCVEAAALLKITAEAVDNIEPEEPSKITAESIENLAKLASAFDSSDDEELKKQASVIDELLLTIAAPTDAITKRRELLDKKIAEMQNKFYNSSKQLDDLNKTSDSVNVINKSQMLKEPKEKDVSLSTRYCPDHPGVQINRIDDNVWQCELDKKTYNFENGYTLNDGTNVPGGSVSNQNRFLNVPYESVFDTREDRVGSR